LVIRWSFGILNPEKFDGHLLLKICFFFRRFGPRTKSTPIWFSEQILPNEKQIFWYLSPVDGFVAKNQPFLLQQNKNNNFHSFQ
jgi:hypothetical protein